MDQQEKTRLDLAKQKQDSEEAHASLEQKTPQRKRHQTSMEEILHHLEQAGDEQDAEAIAQTDVVSDWDASPDNSASLHAEQHETEVSWDYPDPETAEEKFKQERMDLDLEDAEEDDRDADGLPLPRHHDAENPADDDADEKNHHRKRLFLWIPVGMLLLAATGYLTFVFAPIPFVRYWRDIYIETAMTTGDHQWLATSFIPADIIESVMNQAQEVPDVPNWDDDLIKRPETTENLTEKETEVSETAETEVPVTTETAETEALPDPADILGLASLKVGEKDYAGYEVLMIDEEEGLFVSEITSRTYNGRVMLIDDPSRVFVGTTPEKKTRGYRIPEMMDYYGDVVAGINASGFNDPNDCGDGKDIIGYCMSEGETWGTYNYNMASVVLTEENKLAAGYIPDWGAYNIRDGMQFGPPLIHNGELLVEGSSGWGLHPRTAIGQREDGVIILLVIDGRVPSSLMGCTVGDMAAVMAEYGAVNAGCCDGGSSCVLAYKGEVLNKNSSANPDYGRRIPNAFLVRSKKANDETP